MNIFRKKQPKEILKKWILSIENEGNIPNHITAINFDLFSQPSKYYAINLTGAKHYDENDDDWACDQDYIPENRYCLSFNLSQKIDWETALNTITNILKELIAELPNLKLWQVKHITVGFSDGDLIVIK